MSPFQLITEALEKSPVLRDGNKSPLTLFDAFAEASAFENVKNKHDQLCSGKTDYENVSKIDKRTKRNK